VNAIITPPKTRRVVMLGAPNVGKSALFNALTGLRQKVANYAGVTVDALEGVITGDHSSARLLDLPGCYSLHARSEDEAVVERVVEGRLGDRPDVALVVLDASNLRPSLCLLSEVMELGLPVVVALNLVDEARRGGVRVPTDELAEISGLPVVETVAITGEGVDALRQALLSDGQATPQRGWTFEDTAREERLQASPGETPWQQLRALSAEDAGAHQGEVLSRHLWADKVLGGRAAQAPDARARTRKIDRVLLHPVLGPAFFLAIMGLVFQSVFAWADPLMGLIEAVFGGLSESLGAWLPGLIGATATSLVVDGIVAGVGSVVIFLPQILILFLFIGLLEDTGYMARAAFLVDRPLKLVGLSGRSFIPLLSSFACAIPGVMATRTIPGRFERMLAMFVAPLMTCSARLPVYTLLIAAFIPTTTVAGFLNLQGLVLLGLYLGGVVGAVAVAGVVSLLRRTQRVRGKLLPIVVELPPYRRPTLKSVLVKLRIRAGDFLRRAGTVIFVAVVVLWALFTFPQAGPQAGLDDSQQAAYQMRNSYAGRLGHAIEPVIRPLGYDWKIGIGVIASFAAREVFVGTMGVVYSVGEEADEESEGLRAALQSEVDPETGRKVFSLATVCSLLVFYVFALQCASTIAVVRREAASWKFALAQMLAFGGMGYVGALVTFQLMSALGFG
jgi:ferrous iron transport protein B